LNDKAIARPAKNVGPAEPRPVFFQLEQSKLPRKKANAFKIERERKVFERHFLSQSIPFHRRSGSMELHFICRHGKHHADLGGQLFESGNWAVGNAAAEAALGGRIYLHERQDAPAWHGGTIVGWRINPNAPKRKVFRYRVDGPFQVTHRSGWGREKAIVR
jgi:hypothetical protein